MEVVVEHGGNHGDDAAKGDAAANVFSAAGADKHEALKGKGPFPGGEGFLGEELVVGELGSFRLVVVALFENGDEAFNAAVCGEGITDSGGGGGEVGEVVERVDEGPVGGAVKGSPVVERGRDGDRRSIERDRSKISFSHNTCRWNVVWRDGERNTGGQGRRGRRDLNRKKRDFWWCFAWTMVILYGDSGMMDETKLAAALKEWKEEKERKGKKKEEEK